MPHVNSTLAELPLLDQAAYFTPHLIYRYFSPKWFPAVLMSASGTLTLVVGSYATLSRPRHAADPEDDAESPLYDVSDNDGCEFWLKLPRDAANVNGLKMDLTDAVLFPVLAAGTLLGMYKIIERQQWLLLAVLNGYVVFSVLPATYATTKYILMAVARNVTYWLGLQGNLAAVFRRLRLTLSQGSGLPEGLLEPLTPETLKMEKSEVSRFKRFMRTENGIELLKIPRVSSREAKLSVVFDVRNIVSLILGVFMLVLMYYFNPVLRSTYALPDVNWIVSNATATVFAVYGCKLIRVPSVKVAAILLAALFCYDIYFVFASPVMMAVATQVRLPTLLRFPIAPTHILTWDEAKSTQVAALATRELLLGLGDIVIPSVLSALCLRYDHHRYYEAKKEAFHRLRQVPLRYFAAAVCSYAVALSATAVVSVQFGHGQPALLYIVPAMLAAVLGTAWRCDELKTLWLYSEMFAQYEGTEKVEPKKTNVMVVDSVVYTFADTDEESDDTYIIGESTDEDSEDE